MPPRKETKNPEVTKSASKAVKPAVVATPLVPSQKSEVKGSGTAVKAAATPGRVLTHDLIAKRAFEIYASRGYAPGNPAADWAEAERQLKAGL